MRKKKRYFSRATCFILCAVFALLFLLPTVLTITNSFMTQSEITASYGQVFENANDGKSYISKTINLKFIPDKVSFTQYFTVLRKSPDYLLKFWNSVILTAPIVFAQLMVASIAAYGFTRWRGKVRDSLLFFYNFAQPSHNFNSFLYTSDCTHDRIIPGNTSHNFMQVHGIKCRSHRHCHS